MSRFARARTALFACPLAMLALAGCGGPGDAGDAAQLAPARSVAFVQLERGPALTRAETLLDHVSPVPAALRTALARSGAPGGTGRIELAAVPIGGGVAWLAYLPGKPKGLPTDVAHRRVRGWTVVAPSQTDLDAARASKRHLADDPRFHTLPSGLAAVFVRTAGARLLRLPRLPGTRWATVALARDRLTVRQAAPPAAAMHPTTAAAAVDDRTAVAAGAGAWSPAAGVLPALAGAYGVDAKALGRDLPAGSVVALRPGTLLPELTLAGESPHPETTARKLALVLTRGQGSVESTVDAGVPIVAYVLGAAEVDTGSWGSRFAVSTGLSGLLAAHAAAGDLGLPARSEGWLYVDAARARAVAPAIDTLAGGHRARDAVARLGPIARLLAWRTRERGVETTVWEAS
ncbi:MAG TPA: hypothetical protein VF186_01430 [Gaiellaceae bacterium]